MASGNLLNLPGPVPEIMVTYLNSASRKVFRLTCKDARQLVDRTVRCATVDVINVRGLCGPWRPLHVAFPYLRHLTVSLRSTGAVSWDVARPHTFPPQFPPAALGAGGAMAAAGGGCHVSGAASGPAAAAASYSLRLLRDCVPKLRRLTSLDLTHCYLDPTVWHALCSIDLPVGLALRLHPAAALLFPGKSWAERLAAMLGELAAVQPDVRVSMVACGTGEGGGSISAGGAACWCDVDGEAGLRQLSTMSYICELAMCIWSRGPCQSAWLSPLSSLTRLQRLYVSCCNATDPWDHSGLAGLSALAALRELSIGLTDSPLRLTDLAPLAACTALTSLSVGWLAPAQIPGAVGAADFAAAGPAALRDAEPAAAGDAGGAADGGAVVSLPSVRHLEVRCCLSAGPLPLAELVPGAVSVSLCAMSAGGGRVVAGHALTSLLLMPLMPPAGPNAAAAAGADGARDDAPERRIQWLAPQRRARLLRPRAPTAPALQGSPLPPALPPPLAMHLRSGLRSLELIQQDAAAIALGPGAEGTGRIPLPGAEQLGELRDLEHLQLTGWRLRGSQLPSLLASAQRLPRLRRLTLRDCDAQSFGWRATRAAQLSRGLGLYSLDRLVGLQLRALEHLQVLGAPTLRLLEQLALVCRTPSLRCLELHGVRHWEPRAFHRILGSTGRTRGPPPAPAPAPVPWPPTSPAQQSTRRTTRPLRVVGGSGTTVLPVAPCNDVRVSSGAAGGGAAATGSGGGAGGALSCTVRLLTAVAAAASAVSSSGCWMHERAEVVRQAVPPAELSPSGRPNTADSGREGRAAVGCAGGAQPTVAILLENGNNASVSGRPSCAAMSGDNDDSEGCGGDRHADDLRIQPYPTGSRDGKRLAKGPYGADGAGGGCDNCCGAGAGGATSRHRSDMAVTRWPLLQTVVVHGCLDTSLEALRQEVAGAGLAPWVQVEWMANTLALGSDPWVSPESRGNASSAGYEAVGFGSASVHRGRWND